VLTAVVPQGGRQVAPELLAAAGAKPGADDDLGAGGAHVPDPLERGGDAPRPAPVALRRRLAGPGADIAVGVSFEPFDHVFLVGLATSEEVNQKGRRGVAGNRHCCIHRAVSVLPWVGTTAAPSSGTPTAAPLPARPPLSTARGNAEARLNGGLYGCRPTRHRCGLSGQGVARRCLDCIAVTHRMQPTSGRTIAGMARITIRNLDDDVKTRPRLRAAMRNPPDFS